MILKRWSSFIYKGSILGISVLAVGSLTSCNATPEQLRKVEVAKEMMQESVKVEPGESFWNDDNVKSLYPLITQGVNQYAKEVKGVLLYRYGEKDYIPKRLLCMAQDCMYTWRDGYSAQGNGEDKVVDCFKKFTSTLEVDSKKYAALIDDDNGTDGKCCVEIFEVIDGENVEIANFETVNHGEGALITYEGEIFYALLDFNWNLKVYDGIRFHKLGDDPEKESALVTYRPKKYVWKTIYDGTKEYTKELDDYINLIKTSLIAGSYLEQGEDGKIVLYEGDEAVNKVLVGDTEYSQIDLKNNGKPLLIKRSVMTPNSFRDKCFLQASFYNLNEVTGELEEVENMKIGQEGVTYSDFVVEQLWFKKIGDKIFAFRVYHMTDYNYLMDVNLIDGEKITHVRNELIVPSKCFVIKEGEAIGDKINK